MSVDPMTFFINSTDLVGRYDTITGLASMFAPVCSACGGS
jgi:hypothetical protein